MCLHLQKKIGGGHKTYVSHLGWSLGLFVEFVLYQLKSNVCDHLELELELYLFISIDPFRSMRNIGLHIKTCYT